MSQRVQYLCCLDHVGVLLASLAMWRGLCSESRNKSQPCEYWSDGESNCSLYCRCSALDRNSVNYWFDLHRFALYEYSSLGENMHCVDISSSLSTELLVILSVKITIVEQEYERCRGGRGVGREVGISAAVWRVGRGDPVLTTNGSYEESLSNVWYMYHQDDSEVY
ncbi:hypothetical protein Tco_1546987 [Tanacetum coccineum]